MGAWRGSGGWGVPSAQSTFCALASHSGKSRDAVCRRRQEDKKHLNERWGFPGRRGDQQEAIWRSRDTAAKAGARGTWERGALQPMPGPGKNQDSRTRMGGDAPGRACTFEVLLGTELPKARRENLGTEKKQRGGLVGGCTSGGGGGFRSELGSDFSRRG